MILTDGFNYMNRVGGRPLRIRYYTEFLGGIYDDDRTLTQSGNDLFTSGVIQEINTEKGSDDAVLMQEGRLKYGDRKVFIGSQIQTSSGARVLTIALSGASSVEVVYRDITLGVHSGEFFGQDVWKKVYLRQTDGGSLF